LLGRVADAESLQRALTAAKGAAEEALEYERSRATAAETESGKLRQALAGAREETDRAKQQLALAEQRTKESSFRHSDVSGAVRSLLVELSRLYTALS